jgi:hypothetical protein
MLPAFNSLCCVLNSIPVHTIEHSLPRSWVDSTFKEKLGRTTQCSPLAQWWRMLLLRRCIGRGPGVEPASLPFWVIFITYTYMWDGTLPTLEHGFVNSNLVQYLLQTDIQKRTENIQWQIQTLHRDFFTWKPKLGKPAYIILIHLCYIVYNTIYI